jgi:hypothetical protein
MSLDESYPRIQPTTGRKAVDLLTFTHKKLEAAVFAAYGWDPGMTGEKLLERLLSLNIERAKKG